MKKNLFYYLFAVICLVSVFTSCSDDDDDKIVNPVPQTVFNSENGLQLTYNGEPMLGKKVTFTPDATNATKATLRLEGEFDLSGILGNRAVDATPIAPGVFPGTPVTTLPVELSINGDQCTFSGSSETDYCTYSYEGKVTTGALQLAFTDVKLKDVSLAGTSWNMAPTGTMFEGDPMAPIHIKWEADEFPFGNDTWDINSAISLIVSMTQIEGKSIPELLSGVLNKVTFLPDGNIQAEYKDALTDAEWKTSGLNIAMYTVKDNKIYLFLNPSQIMAVANKNRAVDLNEILVALMPTLLPMLSNGIPLSYTTNEDGQMKVYLDNTTLLPILKSIAPMFENEEFVTGLVDMLKEQAGELGALVDAFLKPVLQAMPQIISTTTDIEIGLKLVPEAK
ncbi:DUF4925 domain-containing protein [Phocaeicola sp.]